MCDGRHSIAALRLVSDAFPIMNPGCWSPAKNNQTTKQKPACKIRRAFLSGAPGMGDNSAV